MLVFANKRRFSQRSPAAVSPSSGRSTVALETRKTREGTRTAVGARHCERGTWREGGTWRARGRLAARVGARRSARAEEAVACVAEPGQDVAVRVEFAIERRAVDGDIGVRVVDARDTFGGRDQAQKADARGAGALE